MKRIAFVMSVDADRHEEYRKRHDPIWPELEEALLSHGVRNYSIFLDRETSRLFACAEIESEERWEAIAGTEICRKWWRHMADIMPTNPDSSPRSRELKEVFHIENRTNPEKGTTS
jgi:L-rhamnose mutarotase